MTKEAKNFLSQRRTAYQLTFTGAHGDSVIEDLAKFCRADESTFNPDPRIHALMEGRREVFLRIKQHLNMTDEQLWTKIGQGR